MNPSSVVAGLPVKSVYHDHAPGGHALDGHMVTTGRTTVEDGEEMIQVSYRLIDQSQGSPYYYWFLAEELEEV